MTNTSLGVKHTMSQISFQGSIKWGRAGFEERENERDTSVSQPLDNLERINRWLGPNEQHLQKHHRSISNPCFLLENKRLLKGSGKAGVEGCLIALQGAAASSICQCVAFRNVYI